MDGRRTGRRHRSAFSLRQLSLGFGLFAIVLFGTAVMVREAARSSRPLAALVIASVALVVAALFHRRRHRGAGRGPWAASAAYRGRWPRRAAACASARAGTAGGAYEDPWPSVPPVAGEGPDPRAAAAHPAPPAYADPVDGQPPVAGPVPGAAAADGTEPTLVLPDDAVPTGREAAYPAPPGAAPDTEGFDEFARPAPDPVVAPEASGIPAEDLDGTRDGQDILVEEAGEPDYTALDADEFEQAVAALCERDGCEDVRVVGGAGDLGADVVAVAPDGRRVVIQCKRYDPAHKVGSGDVQRFGGTCFAVHDAEVAAVVTTSEFTEPAAEYAARCGIGCVDGPALTAWALGTGPAPWDPVR